MDYNNCLRVAVFVIVGLGQSQDPRTANWDRAFGGHNFGTSFLLIFSFPFLFNLDIIIRCMPLLLRFSIFSQIAASSALVTVSYLSVPSVIHADAKLPLKPHVKDEPHTQWNLLRFTEPPKRWWEVVDEHSSVSIATDHFQFGI
jgi:hypothetical protein